VFARRPVQTLWLGYRHHLVHYPEQVARDAAFAGEDPLSHNDWLYGYDAEQAAAAATRAG
jgi:hypothetical protein